jgi:hypothetical protein
MGSICVASSGETNLCFISWCRSCLENGREEELFYRSYTSPV